jgi:hypothetical protein
VSEREREKKEWSDAWGGGQLRIDSLGLGVTAFRAQTCSQRAIPTVFAGFRGGVCEARETAKRSKKQS